MKVKRVRPILVETNEPTNIFKDHSGLFHSNLNLQTGHSINSSVIGYKLILISLEYEKIEVGDTIYSEILNEIDILEKMPKGDSKFWFKGIYKVIANQNQLSLEYIAKFVEQYNNGKVDDVEIEMNGEWDNDYNGYYADTIKPKLTDGFISIIENKQTILYTEEEVYELFNSFRKDFSLYRGIQIMDDQLKDWFEQYKKHN